MSELGIEVTGARAEPYAAVPTLRRMVAAGDRACAMEVSSHAL